MAELGMEALMLMQTSTRGNRRMPILPARLTKQYFMRYTFRKVGSQIVGSHMKSEAKPTAYVHVFPLVFRVNESRPSSNGPAIGVHQIPCLRHPRRLYVVAGMTIRAHLVLA
jgi:hypothetical protein